MRSRRSYLAVVVALSALAAGSLSRSHAQSTGADAIPPIIVSGFEAYKVQGAEAAVTAWIKDSAIEGSKEAVSQANVLRQVQDFYGAYKSYDLIQSRTISPTTRVVYMTIDYEKGPLFVKFLLYRVGQAWVMVNFSFNTKEEAILPTSF